MMNEHEKEIEKLKAEIENLKMQIRLANCEIELRKMLAGSDKLTTN
ncbi:hypothetical protein QT711_03195 [Sporosarcina saromensis]|uniref:Transposase n=1 Tax=Sporosarcina saromensis TaxID=359365 RepID=A0ABU4G5D2_9BACL|nr:hypothetical protein [Sporosarcina saromensis]MDW0112176.1 hypothetical protein [Sporosarcina saromensis]